MTFAVRGFQVDGSTDAAVELMKRIKVYPVADAAAPPAMEFLNGSGHDIDTPFPIFRFYGPTDAYFDKTWKLEDITPA